MLWKLQVTQHTWVAPTRSQSSHMSTGHECPAAAAPATGNATQATFMQKPHYGMVSPFKVQLCHQELQFTSLFSRVLHDHRCLGHLWAGPLKETVAKESNPKYFPFACSTRKLAIAAGGKESDANTSQLQVDKCNTNEDQESSQCLQSCF